MVLKSTVEYNTEQFLEYLYNQFWSHNNKNDHMGEYRDINKPQSWQYKLIDDINILSFINWLFTLNSVHNSSLLILPYYSSFSLSNPVHLHKIFPEAAGLILQANHSTYFNNIIIECHTQQHTIILPFYYQIPILALVDILNTLQLTSALMT